MHLEDDADSDAAEWVETASILHSNSDALEVAVRDAPVVGQRLAPEPLERVGQRRKPGGRVVELWQASRRGDGALGAVVGRTRATLLAALDAPRSTTELASALGLSAGGVSAHLTAL